MGLADTKVSVGALRRQANPLAWPVVCEKLDKIFQFSGAGLAQLLKSLNQISVFIWRPKLNNDQTWLITFTDIAYISNTLNWAKFGGRDRDRTCDPLDVNEVLSR